MRLIIAFLATVLCAGAHAQVITPAASGFLRLYSTGSAVGNPANTSANTLQSYSAAAGQLANVGDVLHIRAGGSYAAITDQRIVRLSFGGTNVAAFNTASSSATSWTLDVVIIKTGANTQSYMSTANIQGAATQNTSGTLSITDTASIAILLTGQDQTAATANAIVAQMMTVDYEH